MKCQDAIYLLQEINYLISAKSYKASKWEENFIDSIGELVEIGKDPTPKQAEALTNIYRNAVGGGTYQREQRF